MIKLRLSIARGNKLKNILDFSESNIKYFCIGDSTLRLKDCINDIFSKICSEEVSQIQKNRFRMKYLCKTFEKRKRQWFTILNNWNICIF